MKVEKYVNSTYRSIFQKLTFQIRAPYNDTIFRNYVISQFCFNDLMAAIDQKLNSHQ